MFRRGLDGAHPGTVRFYQDKIHAGAGQQLAGQCRRYAKRLVPLHVTHHQTDAVLGQMFIQRGQIAGVAHGRRQLHLRRKDAGGGG